MQAMEKEGYMKIIASSFYISSLQKKKRASERQREKEIGGHRFYAPLILQALINKQRERDSLIESYISYILLLDYICRKFNQFKPQIEREGDG